MAFNPYYQNPYQPMGYNGQYGNYAPQSAASVRVPNYKGKRQKRRRGVQDGP